MPTKTSQIQKPEALDNGETGREIAKNCRHLKDRYKAGEVLPRPNLRAKEPGKYHLENEDLYLQRVLGRNSKNSDQAGKMQSEQRQNIQSLLKFS